MVYAFNDTVQRRPLWDDLASIQNMITVNGVSLLGVSLETSMPFFLPMKPMVVCQGGLVLSRILKSMFMNLGITDLCFQGEFYTWWDCNVDRPLLRKLNRVLVNDSWLKSFDLSSINFLNRGLSNHCLAAINLGICKEKIHMTFQLF